MENIKALHKDSDDTAVIYFYFDFKDSSKRTTVGMLNSLLSQLVGKLRTVPTEVEEVYKKPNCDEQLTQLQLVMLLRAVFGCFSRIVVLLDALDESTE